MAGARRGPSFPRYFFRGSGGGAPGENFDFRHFLSRLGPSGHRFWNGRAEIYLCVTFQLYPAVLQSHLRFVFMAPARPFDMTTGVDPAPNFDISVAEVRKWRKKSKCTTKSLRPRKNPKGKHLFRFFEKSQKKSIFPLQVVVEKKNCEGLCTPQKKNFFFSAR